MSNLAYCRFENTLTDLEDCYENIENTADMSAEEAKARIELIQLCIRIAEEYARYQQP